MSVPKHIGIIMDGNRRFAKRLMAKPWKGHEWGADKVEKIIEWCDDLGVKELTLYALSIENFDRPKKELDYLFSIFKKEAERLLTDERVYKNKIRVMFVGRLHLLPKDLQEVVYKVMEKTKKHDKFLLNFAVAYSGQAEILDATIKIAKQVKEGKLNINKINEELFKDNLELKDCPDLIIRSGGEVRTSNFMIWQSAYSEWIFLEKMFPEFEKEDFMNCIQEYENRQRRFGR